MILTSIVNSKGGTTKSTSALNLAALAATRNKKTLLVDLDPQGTCTHNIGFYTSCIEKGLDIDDYSVYRVFNEGLAPSSLAQETQIANLHLLPSSSRLTLLEQEIPSKPNGETYLSRIFHNDSALDYDLVIFDSPGYVGHIINSIVNLTGDIIIPNIASASSTRSLIEVMDMVEQINQFRKVYNQPEVNIRGHFFARAEPTTLVHKEQERDVIELFDSLGYKKDTHKSNCPINKSTEVNKSESLQIPFVALKDMQQHKVTYQFKTLFSNLFKEFK